MGENLVIVESPAKAKTIEKFLGKGFTVKSSFGHIRDLSKKKLVSTLLTGLLQIMEISADKKEIGCRIDCRSKQILIVWLASDEEP